VAPTKKFGDLAVATLGYKIARQVQVGDDHELIVNAEARFAHAANHHPRKVHAQGESPGHARLLPSFTKCRPPRRFARRDTTGGEIVELSGIGTFYGAATRDPNPSILAIAIDMYGTILDTERTERPALAAGDLASLVIEHRRQLVAPVGDESTSA